MRKKSVLLKICVFLTALLWVTAVVCKDTSSGKTPADSTSSSESAASPSSWDSAQRSPFGKYPEVVTCTIGRKSNGYPLEQAESDGVCTYQRFLEDFLNIRFMNAFDVRNEEDFQQKVSMAIVSGEIPDIMTVNGQQLLRLYQAGELADLTEAYRDCASPYIQEIYRSYGGKCLEAATFDGKLMALPTTETSHGPGVLWLRKDWMEKLRLPAPETLEDVEEILRRFVKDDPGGNGPGKTVGLLCLPDIAGDSSGLYMLNGIFTFYNAFPKQWILQPDGHVAYGSVQPEMKAALTETAKLYREGLLDPKFLLRTEEDCKSLLTDGVSGAFFGNYWSSEVLPDSLRVNPEADWTPYIVPKNEEGSVTMVSGNPNSSYIVVRKGFAHPEAAVKMASVQFDYVRDKEPEFTSQLNKDGMLLNMNISYDDSFARSGAALDAALQGNIQEKDLSAGQKSTLRKARSYLRAIEEGEPPDPEDWRIYKSRVEAYHLLMHTKLQVVSPVFVRETDDMRRYGPILEELERNRMLSMVTGEAPLGSFDAFVREWNAAGGARLTEQVNLLSAQEGS